MNAKDCDSLSTGEYRRYRRAAARALRRCFKHLVMLRER